MRRWKLTGTCANVRKTSSNGTGRTFFGTPHFMNESGYTRKIGRLLRTDVYTWKISDRFTAGVPDAYYSGPAQDLWVEYKHIAKPPKSTKQSPALSALQEKWLRDRMEEGRNVAVIVGLGTRNGVILTGDDMFRPIDLRNAISCKEIAYWISEFTCGQ